MRSRVWRAADHATGEQKRESRRCPHCRQCPPCRPKCLPCAHTGCAPKKYCMSNLRPLHANVGTAPIRLHCSTRSPADADEPVRTVHRSYCLALETCPTATPCPPSAVCPPRDASPCTD